jgi:hypothetical protein
MKISIEHFRGEYPNFNVSLHTNESSPAFIVIKGCKFMHGVNGEFVSWPSRKDGNGKFWNHIYASSDFNAHVMKLAKTGAPSEPVPSPAPARPRPPTAPSFDDFDSDLPF